MEKRKKQHQAQDLSDGTEPINIKIEVKSIGIEIDIRTTDPCDAMILSGRVVETLRYVMKTEPKSLVLP